MISFKAPLFISLEVNRDSVYKKMLINSSSKNEMSTDYILSTLTEYINNSKPFGISLYGDLYKSDLNSFLQYCKEKDIPLGYDLSCNPKTHEWIVNNKDYFQLFRIVLFSLHTDLQDYVFDNNPVEAVINFIKADVLSERGKVIVIPITSENLDEVEELMNLALEYNCKINPLPLPYDSAIQAGLTPLTYDEYYKLANLVEDFYKKYGNQIYLDMPAAVHTIGKSSVCPAFRLSLDIDFNGYIRPCKFSGISFQDISRIDSLWSEHKDVVPIKCEKCSDIKICAGGCLANGDMEHQCDIYCKYRSKN